MGEGHGYSAQQREQLWGQWRLGGSLSEIARALGKRPSSVRQVLVREGGIAPARRKASQRALRLSEREEISRGLAAGVSIRSIAARLSRAPSSVSREVRRHGGVSDYRACAAHQAAADRARRPKLCKLAQQGRLRRVVASKLTLNWSPQQISAWLERHYRHDDTMRVSHETIYRSLFIQARGALKQQLLRHLRSGRRMRQAKKATKGGQILEAISIRQRAAEAEDRAVPGHWEGDLLCGSKSSQIATLVERHSRFTMLVKLKSKDSAAVSQVLSQRMRTLPATLRRSVTWDRGTELAAHKIFSIATDIKVYFCDPHSPWQRGTNENTNGLLRQYFPKGTDLSQFTQQQLNRVALQLNQRPRKTLGWETPADTLRRSVALTP
ncbi:MAG: IS30 family transposase [Gammaproteobacteria bacterium]|nr:IS30 family transposase [Gammaproteobacteria bacterium]